MSRTQRRRRSTANLIALIVILLVCIWLLYKLFIGIPPAPAPEVREAAAPLNGSTALSVRLV